MFFEMFKAHYAIKVLILSSWQRCFLRLCTYNI